MSKAKSSKNRHQKKPSKKLAAVFAQNAPLEEFDKHNSFVIKLISPELENVTAQLTSDFRRVMEPKTASRLRERRSNTLRDYQAMAGPLGVQHFWVFNQTDSHIRLRFATFPQGPTATFRVEEYSLMRDVYRHLQDLSSIKKRVLRKIGAEAYRTPALLVLNGFPVETSSEARLLVSMLQAAFPAVDTSKCRLTDLHRVAYFEWVSLKHGERQEENPKHLDSQIGIVFRHYQIDLKEPGVSKPVRRLLQAPHRLPSMSHLEDIGDFLLKRGPDGIISATESEGEEGDVGELVQDLKRHGQEHPKGSRRAVSLQEIGPRMSLKLVRIQDSFCEGSSLYEAIDS